jgi:hypothetical protein
MQRKQQVGECWVCVILFFGAPPFLGGHKGVDPPYKRGHRGETHLEKKMVVFCVRFWEFVRHTVFVDGFLFLVKELGLLTNPSYWIRVLDATRSYMYIVL